LSCSMARCTCSDPLPQPGRLDGISVGDGARDGVGGEGGGQLFDTFAGDGQRDRALADNFVAGSLPSCRRNCNTTSDCCATPPCDKGRDAVICVGGTCTLVGCKSNTDCMVVGASAGTCKQIKDAARGVTYGLCGEWCATDAQCASSGEKCVARLLETGDRLCGTPCAKDSGCLPSLVCVEGKFCGRKEQRQCKTDADCAGAGGMSRCHTGWGRCYCANDATCQVALGPLLGGTWRCL
jgi:hypothetical protein